MGILNLIAELLKAFAWPIFGLILLFKFENVDAAFHITLHYHHPSLSIIVMDILNLIAELLKAFAWPIFGLILLFKFEKPLKNLLNTLSELRCIRNVKITIGGQQIELNSFEESLENAIDKSLKVLLDKFPPEKSNRYMPLATETEIAYYVHIVEFLDKINVNIKNSAAWNAVGHYYFSIDKWKSKNYYEKAIEVNPEDPISYTNLGMWYFVIDNDLHSSKECFERSIKLSIDKQVSIPWTYVGLASLFHQQDNIDDEVSATEKAKELFAEALKQDSTNYWAYYGLGWCWARGNADINKATEYTNNALKIKPDFTTARYNLACFKAITNDAKGSVDELCKLLESSSMSLRLLHIEDDEDFKNIEQSAEFLEFMKVLGLKNHQKKKG